MAVHKGREVQILGRSDGDDLSPMYDILDQWNERSSIPLNQLQLTEKEKADLEKQGALHLDRANVISDKDMQSLRDSQDAKKIEADKDKHPTPEFVDAKNLKMPTRDLPAVTKAPAPAKK